MCYLGEIASTNATSWRCPGTWLLRCKDACEPETHWSWGTEMGLSEHRRYLKFCSWNILKGENVEQFIVERFWMGKMINTQFRTMMFLDPTVGMGKYETWKPHWPVQVACDSTSFHQQYFPSCGMVQINRLEHISHILFPRDYTHWLLIWQTRAAYTIVKQNRIILCVTQHYHTHLIYQ